MDCPLCAKLKREYSTESEQEAKATLQQRAACYCDVRPSKTRYEFLQRKIENSRQRQAILSEALSRHVEEDHRHVDDELAMFAY
jgi:hypothetical protein